jgi:nucleoside-diphosphate-sugar epimerase
MKKLPGQDLEFIADNLKSVIKKLGNKHIFITGASGFIGSWLVESIIYITEKSELNISISILTRDKAKFIANYPHLNSYKLLNIIEGDIQEIQSGIIDEVDYIIHAATDTKNYLGGDNSDIITSTIVEGTKNILEIARKQKKLKKLLFLSSGAIYGPRAIDSQATKESDQSFIDCNSSISSYAESKRYAELLCAIYHKKFNVPYVTARCFSFLGPRLPLDSHFAIGNFINNILNNEDIVISGNGKDIRSYLYIADLTIWLLTMLINAEEGKVYNVGSDQYYNLEEIVSSIIKQLNIDIKCKILNRHNSNSFYVPNIDKISQELNVKINNNLFDSIKKTINWYNE